MEEKPLVSIKCLVYNHEPFLRKCLNGFVMQKTSFKFEAIVHDDASIDESSAIIREYAAKYPDIIKPIYERENQYSKQDGSIRKIMNNACRGKYIALCEGDDYWIDPMKLQNQVNFLESNNQFSMCFTRSKTIRESEIKNDHQQLYENLESKEYSGEEILNSWIVPTASVVYRNFNDSAPMDKRFCYGDIVLYLWLAEKGKIFCLPKETSVYRINANSVTQKGIETNRLLEHYDALNEHFDYKYNNIIRKIKKNIYVHEFRIGKYTEKNRDIIREVRKNGYNMSLFFGETLILFFKNLFKKIIYLFAHPKK